jgi:hypothetical protein
MRDSVVVVGADRLAQALLDPEAVRRRLHARLKAGQQGLEGGDVEPLLRAEVLEDEAVRDAGPLGDVVDRDLVVVAAEELLEGDVEELAAAATGPLGCQRARSQGGASLDV